MLASSQIRFLTRTDRVIDRYGGLVAFDARGRRLQSTLALVGRLVLLRIVDRNAAYPVRIDPFLEHQTLVPTDVGGSHPYFGTSVALSSDGSTALIGGNNDMDGTAVGAAWVYIKSGGVWTEQAKIVPGDEIQGYNTIVANGFGTIVALSSDGNTALISGPGDNNQTGGAWIYTRSGTSWTEKQKIAPAATPSAPVQFGTSIALSSDGSTALISGTWNYAPGAVWVYTRSGTTWSEQQKIGAPVDASSGGYGFGSSVALSSDGLTALIGDAGSAAWVYTVSNGTWSEQQQFLQNASAGFGAPVALSSDGHTALVGNARGAAWVYTLSRGSWSNQQKLVAVDDLAADSWFGSSVALSSDGNTALIGSASDIGASWVFSRTGTTWTELQVLSPNNNEPIDSLTLSSDGSTALLGDTVHAWLYTPGALLSSTLAGSGSGIVTSSPAGITCGSTCSAPFAVGETVTLTAASSLGSVFTGWSGGGCSGTGTCSVSMGGDQAVTATFAILPTLSVTLSGGGSGSVSSSPAGISCGSTCSAQFIAGETVALTAAPEPGSVFVAWSGGGCSGTGTCEVVMGSDRDVTATFTAAPTAALLEIALAGTGAGSVTSSPPGISCGSTCSAQFIADQTVTLTATPASGSSFTGWSGGGCAGAGPCTVAMGSDQAVTASFTRSPLATAALSSTLSITLVGSGSGSVSSSPAGINCGSMCAAQFTLGETVTLTAIAASGSAFTGWSGGGCGGIGSCTVLVGSYQSVNAAFVAAPSNIVPPTVTGARKAGGTLSCSPGSWRNDPTAYAYQWYRDGTPLAGFANSTYILGTLDEGTTLTCVVTASNAARQASATSNAVKVPIPTIPHCPGATGSMTGTTIGQVTLEMTRSRARYLYRRHSNRGKQYEDFFCLTPIGVRVGYASPILLMSLPKRAQLRLRGKVLWASTSNPNYSLDTVRTGESITTAARMLGTEPPFHIGLNYWYLARKASYTAVLKVRGTVVQELGIADNALTTSRKAQNALMRSFY